MRVTKLLATVAAAALPLALGGLQLGTAPSALAAGEDVSIQLVLDSSGSMAEKDAAGRPKIDSARAALRTTIDGLDPSAKVGMRVYGATVKDGDNTNPQSKACLDTQQVVAPATGNRAQLKAEVDKYKPLGHTPTVQALKGAVKDLGTSGRRHVILVSDGEANCTPDPCEDVRQLVKSGVTIQVDTVGMSLNDKARAQLKCIAAATGGTYYDAENTDELTQSLEAITKRALRGYTFQGAALSGAGKPEDAQVVKPGQYLDRYAPKQTKYYRIAVPKGHSVAVSATGKPQHDDIVSTSSVEVTILAPDQKKVCGHGRSWTVDGNGKSNPILSAAAIQDPHNTGRTRTYSWDEGDANCTGRDSMLVKVKKEFSQKTDSTPLELVFSTIPWPTQPMDFDHANQPTAFQGLPPQIDPQTHAIPMPQPTTPVAKVVGGTSFNNATELKPGTSSDTIFTGETLLYKVKLGWGQQATLLVDGDGPEKSSADVTSFSPRRARIDSPWDSRTLKSGAFIGKDGGEVSGVHVAPVRASNVFNYYDRIHQVNEPGWYYFAVSVSPRWAEPVGTANPVRLRLLVKGDAGAGKPEGESSAPSTPGGSTSASGSAPPSSGASTPSPDGTPAGNRTTGGATASEGKGFGTRAALVVGGVAGVGLVASGVLLLRRK